MSSNPANPFSPPPEFDRREVNPTCINCGYDLTGLDAQLPCPECGMPIAQSYQLGNLLRYAPTPWLIRTSRGLRLFYSSLIWPVLGMLCFLALLIPLGLLALSTKSNTAQHGFDVLQNGLAFGYILLLPLCPIGYVVACWFISAAPPGGLAPPALAREIVRWVGPVLPAILLLGDRWIPGIPAPLHTLPRLLATALIWSFLFSLRRILEHLERRTTSWDPALIRKYHGDRTNLILVLVICTIGPVWSIIEWFSNGRAEPWSIGGLGWALAVMFLVSSSISRVRDAVWAERIVALAMQKPQPPPDPVTDKVTA